MIPHYNQDGNLPEGIHVASEEELLTEFSAGTARRKWLGDRLKELLVLAKSTGKLERFFVWGSFVSNKESPNDLDLLIIMDKDFELEKTPENCKIIFNHVGAKVRFHADVFWSKSSIGEDTLRLWLDTYQMTKDFKRRGIVEVDLT